MPISVAFKSLFSLSAYYQCLHATHTPPTPLLKKSLKVSLKVFSRFCDLREPNPIASSQLQVLLL